MKYRNVKLKRRQIINPSEVEKKQTELLKYQCSQPDSTYCPLLKRMKLTCTAWVEYLNTIDGLKKNK